MAVHYPYHFIDLDKEQLQRRRFLLDNYGQLAQASILLLPLIYQLSVGLRLLVTRFNRQIRYRPVKQHQSPVATRFRQNQSVGKVWSWQRLQWWLQDEIAPGWETRKEWLIAGSWTAWLLILIIKDTKDDYLHLTKRFGIVAASQFPIHYLLALKSWSPIQYLTRLSHEELNPYHRLLGRIITTLLAVHATLYLNFYVQKGLLSKRIRDTDVLLGVTGIISILFLSTTALECVRHYSYRIFFHLHVILSILLLPVLYFHVSHLRIYIVESIAVYAVLIVQRNLSQATVPATVNRIPSTNLLSITIPRLSSSSSKRHYAGQHVYIGLPSLPNKLRVNPFTIASAPSSRSAALDDDKDGGSINFNIRALSGTTANLSALAARPQPTHLTIEGPYGASKYFPRLETYDRVLLVAGGVGATFTLPIYESLMLETGSIDASAHRVKFIWVVKDLIDASWGVDNVIAHQTGEAEVYVTGSGRNNEMANENEVEMRPLRELGNEDQRFGEIVRRGRPNLGTVVDGIFEKGEADAETVAVLVCGPKEMARALRREVGRWLASGRGVFWHEEGFGW